MTGENSPCILFVTDKREEHGCGDFNLAGENEEKDYTCTVSKTNWHQQKHIEQH